MCFTQQALATTVGVTRQAISAYENGTRKPHPHTAMMIAEALHLTTEQMWEMLYTQQARSNT